MPRGCALVLVVSLGAACGDDRSSGALDAAPDAPADAALDAAAQRFSFFVTSLATMRLQAGSQHVARGPGGGPVHAIDRVGNGPWHDRLGRLIGPPASASRSSPDTSRRVRPARSARLARHDPRRFHRHRLCSS